MKIICLRELSIINVVALLFCLGSSHTSWAFIQKEQRQQTKVKEKAKVSKSKGERAFIMGKAYYSNQTLSQVHVFGKTTLDQVVVQGGTTIHGACKIKDSQLYTLDVKGRTEISNSTIQGATSIQGRAEINNTQLDKLKVYGKFLISESTVKGNLKVRGKFQASTTTFEAKVHTMGRFKVQDAVFQKQVKVIGSIEANQTYFADKLTAIAQQIGLYDVTAQDLYIKNSKRELEIWGKKYKFLSFLFGKKEEPTVIRLSGKTVVKGSITFEAGDGIVLLGDEAIIEGQVIGGVVKRL